MRLRSALLVLALLVIDMSTAAPALAQTPITLDHIVDGLSSAVGAIYGQLAFVPDFLTANATLLGGLGERLLIYHLPDGHYVGVIRGPVSTDPCFEFFGFPGCPPVVAEK